VDFFGEIQKLVFANQKKLLEKHEFPGYSVYSIDKTGISTAQTPPSRILERKG
jgi:hypothetical protein